MVEVEVQSSWNRGGILKGICIHFRIAHRPFIWAAHWGRWTQHRHTYSTFAQVNLTHLPNDPVALWPAWPFTMSICCMYYLKACSYEYSRVQIIDIHVHSTSQVRVINAVPVSDSWSVVSRQFLWAFQLDRHRHRYCLQIYTLTFFEFSICICTTKVFYMFSSLSFDINRVHLLSLYRGT